MMSEELVYLLTDTQQSAYEYARRKGIDRHRLRIISRREHVVGLHGVEVVDVSAGSPEVGVRLELLRRLCTITRDH